MKKVFLNQDQSRDLWDKARAAGMPRRKFLALLAGSGAAAVLAACTPKVTTTPSVAPTQSPAATSAPAAKAAPSAQKFVLTHQGPFVKALRTTYAFSDPFLDMIEKDSGGRITFKRFYNAELVSYDNMLDACSKGTLDMIYGSGQQFESVVPEGDIDSQFFNFPSHVSGLLFNHLTQVEKIYSDAYSKLGVVHLGAFGHHYIVFGTNFPITKLADIKGKRIRTTAGGSQAKAIQALGAVPSYIANAEVYTAMQRGTVDGWVTGEYTMLSNKFSEVTKYCALPPVCPTQVHRYWVNRATWDKLGTELQAIIQNAFDKMAFWFLAESLYEDEQIRGIIKSKGVQYTEIVPAEFAKLKDAARSIQEDWSKRTPGTTRLYQLLQAWIAKTDYTKWTLDMP